MSGFNLKVVEYKINVHWEEDELIEEQETQTEIDSYNVVAKSVQDLPEKAKDVALYNERQKKYCEDDRSRTFILKRILSKPE